MKHFSRLFALPILLADTLLFLATSWLLGQAQISPRGLEAGTPVAFVISPSAPGSPRSLPTIQPGAAATETSLPSRTPQPSLTRTALPSVTLTPSGTFTPGATATETSLPSRTPRPSLTRTARPSVTFTPSGTFTPGTTATKTSLPSRTPQPSFTPTRRTTFTPVPASPDSDPDIPVVPIATILPTTTPIRDLGFLPTLTPTAVLQWPTPMPVARAVAFQSVPASVPMPPPTPQVYSSSAPECVPHGQPVTGLLAQRFSRYHPGIDLDVPRWTPVLATHSGQVIFAGWRTDGYGYLVIVQNGRFITYYAHNTQVLVAAGQIVQVGEVLAASGSTGWSSGPHVHYEIHVDDIPVDPFTFDPQQYPSCQIPSP